MKKLMWAYTLCGISLFYTMALLMKFALWGCYGIKAETYRQMSIAGKWYFLPIILPLLGAIVLLALLMQEKRAELCDATDAKSTTEP